MGNELGNDGGCGSKACFGNIEAAPWSIVGKLDSRLATGCCWNSWMIAAAAGQPDRQL